MTHLKINMFEHNDSGNASLNFISLFLLTISWMCKLLSQKFLFYYSGMTLFTIEFTDVYNYTFKTLSLVSVIMVLIINYPKFKKRIIQIRYLWKNRK